MSYSERCYLICKYLGIFLTDISGNWLYFYLFNYYYYFWDRVLLCSPGWPQTHDPPASVSQVLGLEVWSPCPVIGFILTSLHVENILWPESFSPLFRLILWPRIWSPCIWPIRTWVEHLFCSWEECFYKCWLS
jgi:hypothetical protein